jgi:hypothetical protein
MAMVQFSQRDLLKGTVVEPNWYRMRIEGVGEKPSAAGDSTNFPVEGVIIKNADNGDEKYAGVPVDWMFNSKAIGFAVGFLTSLGVEVLPNTRFDLAKAVGMEIEVFVENDTYQGRVVNRVNHKYRPAQ